MAQAVRLERPGFRSCHFGEGGGWLGNVLLDRCRCVLAMGNSVALVVHFVVARHKDSQCAVVIHCSGAECSRDREKRTCIIRCCLLHLDGAASAYDDAVEVKAQAVVQGPVGVVME